MNISELSIRRPVLATVLTIIILLFGLIGYNTLGVREYPSVDNPIISVTCSYSGANADVIENQITEPLEQTSTVFRESVLCPVSANKGNAVSQWNLNYPSIWKLPPMTYATKCPAHNVTCHATVTLLLYPRLMPMQRLS